MANTPLAAPVDFANRILRSLPKEAIERLALRPVELEVAREIESPGNPINNLFFLETGAASMTNTFEDGSQVEVGLFGYESVIGVSALMGTKRSLNRVYMQVGGHGYTTSLERGNAEFQRKSEFQSLALRFVQIQLIQATQSAGCNGRHDVEQRLARWLLLCADRVQSKTLPLSQDFIATMLGVRRMSAGLVLAQFRELGLIQQHRLLIELVDIPGLERKSCECYRVVKDHLNNFEEFDSGAPR